MTIDHRQDQRLLEIIDAAWRDEWTSPTVRQMADALGVTVSSAHVRLQRLVREGRLERRQVSPLRVLYRRGR